MFGIDSSEFLLIAVVALLVIGPKDLPRVMRLVGGWVGRGRAMTRHLRAGFDTMMREAELDEMQKQWAKQNEAIMAATAPAAVGAHAYDAAVGEHVFDHPGALPATETVPPHGESAADAAAHHPRTGEDDGVRMEGVGAPMTGPQPAPHALAGHADEAPIPLEPSPTAYP